MKKKAALYARVSNAKQEIDMQVFELMNYAEKNGYEIYKIYQDIAEGMVESRPKFDEMMRDAQQRRVDAVIVWKFENFSLSLDTLAMSLDFFRDLEVKFISCQEDIDTATPIGRLTFHIQAAYKEYECNVATEHNGAKIKADKKRNCAVLEDYRRQLRGKMVEQD